MKRYVVFCSLVLVALLTPSSEAQKKKKMLPKMTKPTLNYVHVVLFTMKKDTTAEQVEEVIVDCHKMLGRIPTVCLMKVGRPAGKTSPKFVKKNYDVALLIVVDDFAALQTYIDDPIHVAFVKNTGEHFDMEKLQVFDFANQNK